MRAGVMLSTTGRLGRGERVESRRQVLCLKRASHMTAGGRLGLRGGVGFHLSPVIFEGSTSKMSALDWSWFSSPSLTPILMLVVFSSMRWAP